MSSTSRSPDDDPPTATDDAEKKLGSPGRYSSSTEEGADVPPTRIDSTTRMPAVRVDHPSPTRASSTTTAAVAANAAPAADSSGSLPRPDGRPDVKPPPSPLNRAHDIKRAPINLPSRAGVGTGAAHAKPGGPPAHATPRAMPAQAPARTATPPTAAGGAPAPPPPAAAATAANVDAPKKPEPPKRPSAAQLMAAAATAYDSEEAKTRPGVPPVREDAPRAAPLTHAEQEDAAAAEPKKPASVVPPVLAHAQERPASIPPKAASIPPRAGSIPPRPISIAPPAPTRKTSSLRPSPSKEPSRPPSIPEPVFQLDLDEGSIAFAFDALVSEDSTSEPGTHQFDLAPVRELFAELAANHMRHVRDFMIDVKWGEVTRDWINICVPPVRTLRRAAERLDLEELGLALERLGGELDAANGAGGGHMLDTGEKERLLDAYGELVTILPQAFALDRDKTQREAVIVQALLLQVPDVRKVTIDKLHAAGLTSLTVLFEANAHDIAQVAGIPHPLASKIVERVQAYRAELQSSSPQDARAAEREKLAALNQTLKAHHDAYEQASNLWGPDAKAKKRDHFRAREETWLEISVLLARFGEIDRLQGIEKVPFVQRIHQLMDYLEEARDKYRGEAQ